MHHTAVLGGALDHDLAVRVPHARRRLAVAEQVAQLPDVAVADHLPELRAVGRVGQRYVHVPHARKLHVGAFQRVVRGVAEVEHGVQVQGREERRVLLRGVREVPAAVQHPVAHPPAVHGRQSAHVPEVAYSAEFRLRCRREGGSCCVTAAPRASAVGDGRRRCRGSDDTTSLPRPYMSVQVAHPLPRWA